MFTGLIKLQEDQRKLCKQLWCMLQKFSWIFGRENKSMVWWPGEEQILIVWNNNNYSIIIIIASMSSGQCTLIELGSLYLWTNNQTTPPRKTKLFAYINSRKSLKQTSQKNYRTLVFLLVLGHMQKFSHFWAQMKIHPKCQLGRFCPLWALQLI